MTDHSASYFDLVMSHEVSVSSSPPLRTRPRHSMLLVVPKESLFYASTSLLALFYDVHFTLICSLIYSLFSGKESSLPKVSACVYPAAPANNPGSFFT